MSKDQPRAYAPVAESPLSTVVAEFIPDGSAETAYQSEADLERELIRILGEQAYERLTIRNEADLIPNLRRQLELLNDVVFSDEEWARFFTTCIAGANEGIQEKTLRIQEDHVQLLKRDDGTTKNIQLLDKADIHNNRLQVINQYEAEGTYANRYDVTILVNGLPLVHVELKRRGVNIREAFNQINRYQRDSFWADSGLFQYVQLFVISNGTQTKYYSNTTRNQHIKEAEEGPRNRKKTSNSYEFTSWWADANNKPIQDLRYFAKTFFAKHALLNILTRYCVLTSDNMLLVMRPYQIVATERILQRIEISTNYKKLGTVEAGGYVWHTTGSGKTLTSFKTAQLASTLESVDKVLFVVDRKDLDYQTMKEYDRFQRGAANSNTSTAVLKSQLEDPAARIIITTIQKLSTFIKANKGHEIYGKHAVIIFDECHRSQFGDMHTDITRAFKRYNLFGFTGTPIFAENSTGGGNPQLKTTAQAFGEKLHTYTIVDAITDKNVLPFRIDYINTMQAGEIRPGEVPAIDTDSALLHPERIANIVKYTLEHFDQKTLRQGHSSRGFNALFAVQSIDAARRYYNAFALQQAALPAEKRLNIGLIYSYGANEASSDGILDDEAFDTNALSGDARTFLDEAIQDYNDLFGTSFDTSADRFQNYYKDLSLRLKNRELDLVIVVNMFLTGFDATTLNTLFVDKNLKAHGLIQAFSRTNRILNSVKRYGNIVSFRNLEDATNEALELFGNKDGGGVVILKPYREYYADYSDRVDELQTRFPAGEPIEGEAAQKEFIKLFGQILQLENILRSFDDFAGQELLTPRAVQDYKSVYLDLHSEFRANAEGEKEAIDEDLVFEIELIKQVEVNVDYILMLVDRNRDAVACGDHEVTASIMRNVAASPTLRERDDLVRGFLQEMTVSTDSTADVWQSHMAAEQAKELEALIAEERLKPQETRAFLARAFEEGGVQTAGTAITEIMPRASRFSPSDGYGEKKRRVVEKITALYERFAGLGVRQLGQADSQALPQTEISPVGLKAQESPAAE